MRGGIGDVAAGIKYQVNVLAWRCTGSLVVFIVVTPEEQQFSLQPPPAVPGRPFHLQISHRQKLCLSKVIIKLFPFLEK